MGDFQRSSMWPPLPPEKRGFIQFVRNLALLPGILANARRWDDRRRYAESPEGKAELHRLCQEVRAETEAMTPRLKEEARLAEARATAKKEAQTKVTVAAVLLSCFLPKNEVA